MIYPPEDFPPERVGVQPWQAMQLSGVRRPKMCLIATATGDSREYVNRWYEVVRSFGDADLSHLELFVQPNVPDVRAHLLALGFLPFSNGVHDDLGDQPRRQRFRESIAAGALPAGYATEDGVALHYVGTRLHEAVSVLSDRNAWFVEADGPGRYREEAVPARCWVPGQPDDG